MWELVDKQYRNGVLIETYAAEISDGVSIQTITMMGNHEPIVFAWHVPCYNIPKLKESIAAGLEQRRLQSQTE